MKLQKVLDYLLRLKERNPKDLEKDLVVRNLITGKNNTVLFIDEGQEAVELNYTDAGNAPRDARR